MALQSGTKLRLVVKDKNVIYIDDLVLNRWEDLNVIHVKGPNLNQRDIQGTLSAHFQNLNIQPAPLIIFGDELDMEIYQVTPEVEKTPFDANQLQLEIN